MYQPLSPIPVARYISCYYQVMYQYVAYIVIYHCFLSVSDISLYCDKSYKPLPRDSHDSIVDISPLVCHKTYIINLCHKQNCCHKQIEHMLKYLYQSTGGSAVHDGTASHNDLNHIDILWHSFAWQCAYATTPSVNAGDENCCHEPCVSHHWACHSKKERIWHISSWRSRTSSSHQWAHAHVLHHSTCNATIY